MATLHVRSVPDELYARIQELAAARKRSLSGEVITLLESALQEAERQAAQAEPVSDIQQRRFVPPSESPDSVTLLREDRNRYVGTQTPNEVAEMTIQQTLSLPPAIGARFRPADRFVVWSEGDTLHLKRITALPVTAIVERATEGEPLSLDELNAIVHQVRRERRAP